MSSAENPGLRWISNHLGILCQNSHWVPGAGSRWLCCGCTLTYINLLWFLSSLLNVTLQESATTTTTTTTSSTDQANCHAHILFKYIIQNSKGLMLDISSTFWRSLPWPIRRTPLLFRWDSELYVAGRRVGCFCNICWSFSQVWSGNHHITGWRFGPQLVSLA